MPDVPIVDTHVHLWNPRRFRMAWIDGNEVLDRAYELNDYREHARDVNVEAIVYMEVAAAPHYMLHEAQWANVQAEREPWLRAIVAHAPLEDGEPVRSHLEALRAVGPRIKAVRRVLENEQDPRFCLRPDFVRGVRMLGEFGFMFHICVLHHQLPGAIELVRQRPEIGFILDHIGKPDIKNGVLDPWRAHVRELASTPNVSCKISGLVTEADHKRWTTDDLRPYVEHVIECFGEDRVLFGSDFPVLLQAASYPRWIAALAEITNDLSDAAKRKLWAGNARRIYEF